MKKLMLFIATVLLTLASSFAQDETLSYQAVVRDSHNKLVRDTDIPVDVSIIVGGTERYYETRTAHTNRNGVISFSIGGEGRTWPVSGHPSDEFGSITGWRNASIVVTFHLSDGDVVTNSPVAAVPYALEAANSININIEEYLTIEGLCDSIENNCSNVVLKDADNIFTGTNNVPRGFDISATDESNCNNVVVNACDLLAVFDSLTRRMNAMQQELDELKRATMPTLTLTSDKPENILADAGEEVGVTYKATLRRTEEEFSYTWYLNGVLQEGQTKDTIHLAYNTFGSYKVLCVATSSTTVLMDSLTTTICLKPDMEYSIIGGESADFGKIRILSSTATSATWYDENGTEIGNWNSGLTDILPSGDYTVVLSSSAGCDMDTVITMLSSPLCPTGSMIAEHEESVTLHGNNYVTVLKDHQGNRYNVVDIGGVCWTRENMRCTQYYDAGTNSYIDIPDGAGIAVSLNDAYRYNPDGRDVSVYGYLYNWIAAIGDDADNIAPGNYYVYTRGVCPEGWHLPSYYDFYYILHPSITNARNNAGKLVGGNTWTSCCDGTSAPGNYSYEERNSTGFSALQAGRWDDQGNLPYGYYEGNSGAYFWSTFRSNEGGYYFAIWYDDPNVWSQYYDRECGAAVRCVRNE